MEKYSVTTWLITGVVFFAIYTVIMKLFKRQHLYKLASKFAGPTCWPVIGNADLFMGSPEDLMISLNQFAKLYPSPSRFWLGHVLIFFVYVPEHFKLICLGSKTVDKSVMYEFARPWIGTGIFTAPDAKWRVHRKLVAPSFHLQILHSFIEIFSARSLIMIKELEHKVDGSEFEIHDYISQYALNSICETSLGVNLGKDKKLNHYYKEAAEYVMNSIVMRAFRPWIYTDFMFARTELGKNQQKYIKFLHSYTDNVIQTKKEELVERGGHESSDDTENVKNKSTSRRKAFLDLLMQLSHENEALSDQALREEVDTIIVAGSDTTASAVSFTMLMLASHPEIQDKVYNEICEVYKDHDASEDLQITDRRLNRMPYLHRVIKEVLRLFPTLPFIIRRVNEDLDIGDYTMPKGSEVILSIIDLHRNEKYWSDPLIFNPDRFLPEEVAKRDPYAYFAFSGGPRNCIGSKYAMLSIKTFTTQILWKYILKKDNIVPVKDIRLKMEFILRTVDPITLRIERRKPRIS